MSEWTPYQTDHLFLLIGTNPLQNYVAALLLAKDNGTIHLLHSGGTHSTAEIAANLERAIRNRLPQVEIIPREINEADSGRIAQKMREILNNIGGQGSVGVHYTGGTKAMAVYVYKEVEKKFPSAVFSYLDARTLSLMIEGRDGAPTKSISVGQACEVKMHELVALHGRPLKSCEKETCLEQTYSSLVDIHATNPKVWRKWRDENLRRPNQRDKFKSKTDLKAVELPSADSVLVPLVTSLGHPRTLEDVQLPTGWKIDKLAEFLDGKWLEQYALNSLKQAATDCHIHDCGMNLATTSEGQSFEFDVAAMRGYQLFALSCTTSAEKGLCKHKLFEAYVRARQMGGDEARVALVCC